MKSVLSVVIVIVCAVSFLLVIAPMTSDAQQEGQGESDFDKRKEELLKASPRLEQELVSECASRAKTEAELERCFEEAAKTKRMEETNEALSEMGMTFEDRQMQRFRPSR